MSGSSASLSGLNGYGAILFDLDGTLVDSLPALTASINAILREDGHRPLDAQEVRLMVGDGIKTLIARAYAATGPQAPGNAALDALVQRFLAHYDPDPTAGCSTFPHAAEILAGLFGMGFKLGVVTNKLLSPTRSILRHFALAPVLHVVVGGDSTPHMKPHPEPFLHAADQMGIAPERVVMVGDSINDVEGAHRAGMRAIAVGYGYSRIPAAEFGAEAVIDALTGLPRAVAALPPATVIAP
jgi:phosphoglycolate phosphatase